FSMVNIFARAFYALGDVTIPMRISVFCLAINLLLAALFLIIFNLGAGGLGIANTITSALNISLLAFALRKKLKQLNFERFRGQLSRLFLCAVPAAGVAFLLRYLWTSNLGHETTLMRLGEVFLPMTAATLVYFGVAVWLKIPAAQDFLGLLTRRLGSGKRE
ncbi:MAG: lipid II flippase MurJ, partial [Limisphaerales bacterium]